jgi:hypothetical protein
MEMIKQPLIKLRHLQKRDSYLRLTHSLQQLALLYQSINLILDRLTITFLVRLLVVLQLKLPLALELHRIAKMLSRSRTLLLASAIALGATTASAQSVYTPKIGTAERTAIMNAARAAREHRRELVENCNAILSKRQSPMSCARQPPGSGD